MIPPWITRCKLLRQHGIVFYNEKISASQPVVGKITVIKLLRYVTSDGFVTFKIGVTSNCNGTVTFKSG
jgi:hypothetical protein